MEKNKSLRTLLLKKNEERRARAGHLWIFSNEIDSEKTPLRSFEPGELVEIRTHNGRYLGTGYVNPASLICARILETEPNIFVDEDWFYNRLRDALSLRERIYSQPYYRMVFGEGDGLPGLTIDRFGDYLIGQITTAGMERWKSKLEGFLRELIKPKALFWRNDTEMRKLEGIKLYRVSAFGELPEKLKVQEGELSFFFDPKKGQKTGWYYDQADNRSKMLRYIRGGKVLDLYSYVGAWGIRAAKAGADKVICADSSLNALELAQLNAEMNGVEIETVQSEAIKLLKELYNSGELFDFISADPPSFIKRKADKESGKKAYHQLCERVLRLLKPGGIAAISSCSYHLQRDELLQILRRSALKYHLRLQILESSGQGPDHPIHPAIPETEYLKTFFCTVFPKR